MRSRLITALVCVVTASLAACSATPEGGTGGGSGTGGGGGAGGGTSAFTPNDPLFGLQWHLRNTGQMAPGGTTALAGEDLRVGNAWALGRGTGVRIAIVDDGLDVTHPDLLANVVPDESHDYMGGGTSPTPLLSPHGTGCAGLAAAVGDNNLGVTGVAMNSKMVGYNLLQNLNAANSADAMTRGLAANHIYSNSWGATDGTGALIGGDAVWRSAIDTGITTGRNGRGAIYVWAAGNGAPADRSDYEGQSNYRGVISVGALNSQGKKSGYSEEGSAVLVSAYGGEFCDTQTTITTDVHGGAGYNDGGTAENLPDPDFSRCFNGTSAATPEVSGVIALVLEANPNLTWRQVRWLISHTTRRNDPGDSDWVMNGANRAVNHKYGFGVVDATAATEFARHFDAGVNLSGPQLTATAASSAALAIPDNTGTAATSTVMLTGSALTGVEFVDVTVTSDHEDFGQLTIVLTSPSGTRSVLATAHSCVQGIGGPNPMPVACGAMLANGHRFGVARLQGEAANGTWTLSVQDGTAGGTGSLTSWNLNVYGY